MRVAFWTASAFARPLHALQQWWHRPTASDTHGLSTSRGAVLSLTVDSSHIAASSSNTRESIDVERASPLPISSRPVALAPIQYRSPGSLVTPIASQKIHRTSSRPAATRRHGMQRPMRAVHCSVSTQEAGHFFIAGRMADVCAELERLAAHEAAH